MRSLKTSDIFKASKILSKMGLKLDTKEKTQEQLGAELIMSFIENIWKAEDEVNDFLADMAGITAEEFANLPIDESIKIMNEFKNLPNISSFLSQAGLLTK